MPGIDAPDLSSIGTALKKLSPYLIETPVLVWQGDEIGELLGLETRVAVKLELLQRSGSFKARGAILNVLALSAEARARGVTAVSSGNHAIATAFAASTSSMSAKVVMLASANAARVALCRRWGAEVLMAPDGASAFKMARELERIEGRTLLHPFDGEQTILGTAALGLEFVRQAGPFDAVVIPIGGGGLCSGVAAAVKQTWPKCQVFGVEPTGADCMHRSFALGRASESGPVRTIADSLGAPFASETSFALCRRFVDQLVMVEDDEIRAAMGLIFRELKFAVEPAAAAATAAIVGPLRKRLRGQRVGMVLCGSNIDFKTYAQHVRSVAA